MVFRDKVVLITGGSSGLGAACVRKFEQQGALISIIDALPPTDSVNGRRIIAIGDVADPATRERVVRRTFEAFGRIDVVVNNVGIGLYQPASRTDLRDLQRLFEVNVFAAMELTQLAIGEMKHRRQGWIANVSSIGASIALPWSMAYCASKIALHSYSDSLRREVRGYGIHVSTIVPGIIRTDFREHVIGGSAPPAVLGIRRSVSPDQVAAALIRSLERRSSRVFIPWYGRVLGIADLVVPRAMDTFLARYWTPDQADNAGAS